MPGALTAADCRFDGVRVTRQAYAVDGWGVGELWRAGGEVLRHESPGDWEVEGEDDELVTRLRSYFAGERVELDDVPVDLDWCTPFQRAVADRLRALPWGEVVSYGELAALAGHPNAQRAVGTFCAGNPLFLFVPCHRVVGAGGIGSYGPSGVAFKRRLLRLEGHAAL